MKRLAWVEWGQCGGNRARTLGTPCPCPVRCDKQTGTHPESQNERTLYSPFSFGRSSAE